MTDVTLNNLVINELTKAQYDALTPSANQLYLVTDESTVQTINNVSPDANGNIAITAGTNISISSNSISTSASKVTIRRL